MEDLDSMRDTFLHQAKKRRADDRPEHPIFEKLALGGPDNSEFL